MGKPTSKIRFCDWIFLISLHPITLTNSAFPIDIVTEKITGDIPKAKFYQIIPDKDPLLSRRQWWWTRRTTTTKRYALFLKYYDSHYEEYYDFPYVTIKPKYPVPGMEFGIQLAKAQVPPLLFKMAVGGGKRMPRPQGTFQPPHLIHIPEEIENYTHVNFHYNYKRVPSDVVK